MKKNKRVILASASPRRKELMEDIGVPFDIVPSCGEEALDPKLSAEEAIEQIALAKAKEIAERFPDAIVLGCDTAVCLEHEILGKPKDKADAERMLRLLSGRAHKVISAVAVLYDEKQELFHDVSEVTFYPLEDSLIEAYLSTDEPYDKAGAYGIQGKGKLLVKELKGDYFSVMGLPVARVYRLLRSIREDIC